MVKQLIKLVSELLAEEVVALYLRGSLARGDWVPELSDIDFYFVIKDHIFEDKHLQSHFMKNLQTIIEEIRGFIPAIEVSCRCESESKILSSKVGSFITSQDSQFLYGHNILQKIPTPTLKEIKEYGKRMVIDLCNHWIKTEEQREKPQKLEDAVNGAQYMILKLAQNGLFVKGILKFKKEEIVNTFLSEYPEFQLKNLVEEAYRIRQKWTVLKENKTLLKRFIK
jgi:hypothetical protein